MNREILFKAKRIDNGEWVEGHYIYHIKRTICPLGDSVKPEDEQHVIMQDGFSDWNMPRGTVVYEIDPDTLCQYTGLADENGKKIWENDILRGHGNDDDLAKVVFGEFDVIDVETHEKVDRVIGWHTKVIETDVLSKCEPFCLPMPLTDFYIKRSEFEVYGNIFDNPELLEVEQ